MRDQGPSGRPAAMMGAGPPAMRRRGAWFGVRREVPVGLRRAAGVAGFALPALVYVWISHQPWASEAFFPRVGVIARAALELVSGPELWLDIAASAVRVSGGFLLSALVGIPLGVLMGSFRLVEGFCQPPVEFLRYVPVPAIVPVVMIFFGIDEAAKWALIFAGTAVQLVIMVADEIRRVPYEFVQITETMGGARDEIVRRVLFRAALPGIFDALRLCHGWAWTYVVVAEIVAASEGLGYRILRFYRFIQTPQIYVYLVVLGFLGLGIDLAFRRMNRRLFPWAETAHP